MYYNLCLLSPVIKLTRVLSNKTWVNNLCDEGCEGEIYDFYILQNIRKVPVARYFPAFQRYSSRKDQTSKVFTSTQT